MSGSTNSLTRSDAVTGSRGGRRSTVSMGSEVPSLGSFPQPTKDTPKGRSVGDSLRLMTVCSSDEAMAQLASHAILTRFFNVMSISLSVSGKKKVEARLFKSAKPFELLDVDHVGGRVKHMNIVALAKGKLYYLRGLIAKEQQEAHNLYTQAVKEFATVLSSSPTNQDALLHMARAMNHLLENSEKLSAEQGKDDKLSMWDPRVSQIDNYLGRLTRFHPKFARGHVEYAKFLQDCGRVAMAEKHFLQALEAEPTNSVVLFEYGSFLTLNSLTVMGRQFLLYATKAKERQTP